MRPEAVAAMVEVLERVPGNPSGQHRGAREARRLLDDARDVVARHLGCRPNEVVFTSGGTEADNLAVTGSVSGPDGVRGLPVCLATDHHAVLHPVQAAGGRTVVVGPDGVVDLDDLARVLAETDDVGVVSVALVNNEVGTLQPLEAIAAVVRSAAPDASLHVDAVAAAAWLDLAEACAGADLVSISGHKVGGPKGIGALAVRHGVDLEPILLGGSQEWELRAGTPNLAGAIALAAALEATAAERSALVARVGALTDRLRRELVASVPDLVVTGAIDGIDPERVPNIVHACVPWVEREALLFLLDQAGVLASAGSSCASGAMEPSHVLEAMGVDPHVAGGALRFSLGWSSTEADVDAAVRATVDAVAQLTDRRVCGTAQAAIDRLAAAGEASS